ncbi:thialysine N-epsilon-acetyltransferase-like [Plodia interpunctella]|uniref:thialysine N-epsilon-acetyltransferase-like n=1 Tax=Plodia interpunctella TaxID=58824 RepID=UPI0023681CC6|nr:thialysine N-epsilon-acetyltransferase-like [Plodia interpunctella]XP_053601359.1 thialysine N-epsilon-acetyltransferase-like [Plodia interpunctella]
MSHESSEEDDLKIRHATKNDMAEVAGMIQELAKSINDSLGPRLTVQDLETHGFGIQPPAFHCKVAEATSDRAILGYALYYPTYSSWEGRAMMLEDLYVRPSERYRGINKKLFSSVAKEAVRLGCYRLDFHLLKWNPTCVYYEQRGAVNLAQSLDWRYYRLRFTPDIMQDIFEK